MTRQNSSEPRPKGNLYADVTNKIVTAIEAGAATYSLPWQRAPGMPKDVVSNRACQGVNTVLLSLIGNEKRYTTPARATFRQCRKEGHPVRENEKSALSRSGNSSARIARKPAPSDDGEGGDNRRPTLSQPAKLRTPSSRTRVALQSSSL